MYKNLAFSLKLDDAPKCSGNEVSRHPNLCPYVTIDHHVRKVVYKGMSHFCTSNFPSINTFGISYSNDSFCTSMYNWTLLSNALYKPSREYRYAFPKGMGNRKGNETMTEWQKQTSVPPMWKPELGEMVIGEIVDIKETDNGMLYTVNLLEDASIHVKYIDDAKDAQAKLVDFQTGEKITMPGHAGIVGALAGFGIGTLVKIENTGKIPAKKGKNDMFLYSVMTKPAPMQARF